MIDPVALFLLILSASTPILFAALGELVAEYPMEERFWAQLLLALHKAGRQAAVLTRFAECRQVMNEHLGVEPGTRDMHGGTAHGLILP